MLGGVRSQQADTTTPAPTTVDSAGSLPNWLLVALLVLVALVIIGMFTLTLYNLSAPRSTLKNIMGLKPRLRKLSPEDRERQARMDNLLGLGGAASMQQRQALSPPLIEALSRSARVGNRTTRTTLAITGFSLLGIVVVGIFGLSGQGVRDLRSQVVAAVSTLVAAIVGFYFGSQSTRNTPSGQQRAQNGATTTGTAPILTGPSEARFTVGAEDRYRPTLLSGTPAPKVKVTSGSLPAELTLDEATGELSGTPTGPGRYDIVLTASNGISPDATLSVALLVVP